MLAEIEVQAAAGAELTGVRRVFGDKTVLDGVNLTVPRHERLGIVGRSGSGKSTLLSLVAGLDEADGGRISVGGADTATARLTQCALMPQRDSLLPWRTALDNACIALENRGVDRRSARRQAAELFARVGLEGADELRPSRLSGGMRQRVAFVRTLLAGKDVLLLDEPFGALDAITRAELQEWLRATLADEPSTALLVTHDVEEALYLCDTVAVLADGKAETVLAADVPRDGPRREVVTSPRFVELRERVLEAIG